MADTEMTNGDYEVTSPCAPLPVPESPMQVRSCTGSNPVGYQCFGTDAAPTNSQLGLPTGSPTKYVAPRLRRSPSPASPLTVLAKRPLAADGLLHWRNNQTFRPANSSDITTLNSPPDLSPPHKVLVAHWGDATFPTGEGSSLPGSAALRGLGPSIADTSQAPVDYLSGGHSVKTHEVEHPVPVDESTTLEGPPATPAYRRLFRSVCKASFTKEIFEGARIKHGRFSAPSLSTSLHAHSERGVILSFSQRAQVYDHFRVWIDSHLANAGILVDDASQLGHDFFLLLLHDHDNQQLALKQKLFFLNKSTVEEVVSENLGPVLYFPETKTLVHHTNPRILIRWSMPEDIIDFLSLDDHGDTLLQQVTFLNHPDCCHQCKRPGHLLKDCTNPPHFRNDARNRLNTSVPQTAPVGSPVADSQPVGPRPAPLEETAPVLAKEVALPVPLRQINSPTLPVNLHIRTSLPEMQHRNDITVEDLPNPEIAFNHVLVPELLPEVSPKPLSPGLSSQGHSAGSKRWADYSLDLDGGAALSTHSPGGGRIVLSPHVRNSSERQRDRSPESGHCDGPRFGIKNAARHSKRAGRGAGKRDNQFPVSDFQIISPSFACTLTLKIYNVSISLWAVYAPGASPARTLLWSLFDDLSISTPIILLGDFNNIENPPDSLSSSPLLHGAELTSFNSLLVSHCLVDCFKVGPPVIGPWYTRFRISEGLCSASRLDRIYLSDEGAWLSSLHSLEHWSGQNLSDHFPVVAQFSIRHSQPVQRRPPALSFPPFILDRDDFQNGLRSVWLGSSSDVPIGENWDLNIASTRNFIKQYVKNNRFQGHHIPLLEAEIQDLHGMVAVHPNNAQLRAVLASKLMTLKQLAHARARREYAQSGARWAAQGDLPSSFFFKKAKRRRESTVITHIQDANGTELTDHSHIAARFTLVYRDLYSAEPITPDIAQAQTDLLLLTHMHEFSTAELHMLNKSPSSLEIMDTLKAMKKDVAPGPDGLSSDFFVKCWDVVGNDLVAFVQNAWHTHYLSARTRMAAIVPIPKSLAVDRVEQWRPISLLDVICKLFAKIIASRLGLIIGLVVSKQQGGFIRGRGTFPNIL
ncbi:unnamed protein product [Calypogeia fissa]